MSFTGFPPATFTFLRGLAANNNREWFAANKSAYERAVLAPFHLLLADVVSELAKRGIPLSGDPKKAIFRVYRDVRFSKEKLPYKTHAGAILTRDGIKGASGVLYVHIDPEGCFLAAGFHNPDREQLAAIREAIYIAPDRFQAIRAGLTGDAIPGAGPTWRWTPARFSAACPAISRTRPICQSLTLCA